MKIRTIVLSLLFSLTSLFAQKYKAPEVEWSDTVGTFGLDSTYFSEFNSCVQLKNGDLFAFGRLTTPVLRGQAPLASKKRYPVAALFSKDGKVQYVKKYDSLINYKVKTVLQYNDSILFAAGTKTTIREPSYINYVETDTATRLMKFNVNGDLVKDTVVTSYDRVPYCCLFFNNSFYVGGNSAILKADTAFRLTVPVKEVWDFSFVELREFNGFINSICIGNYLGTKFVYGNSIHLYTLDTNLTSIRDSIVRYWEPEKNDLQKNDFDGVNSGTYTESGESFFTGENNENALNGERHGMAFLALDKRGKKLNYTITRNQDIDIGLAIFNCNDTNFVIYGKYNDSSTYLRKFSKTGTCYWELSVESLNLKNVLKVIPQTDGYIVIGMNLKKRATILKLKSDSWISAKNRIKSPVKLRNTKSEYYTLNGKCLGSKINTQKVNRIIIQKNSVKIKPVIQLK